jgi:hypothetical protein
MEMVPDQPADLTLPRIIRDLERLRNEATAGGDNLAMLAYLIDMSLVEARERQKD